MSPVAITLGDVAGIGPEVVFKAIRMRSNHPGIVLFLHPDILTDDYYQQFNCDMEPYQGDVLPNRIYYVTVADSYGIKKLPNHADNATIAYLSIIEALKFCQKHNASLVTAPISKQGFLNANIPFTGHTTLLKDYFKIDVAMAFYSKQLKVVLASIHLPLSEVEEALTEPLLQQSFDHALLYASQLGIKTPKIAVAGLNPHASEDGQFGSFEKTVLTPLIKKQKQGVFFGPKSPDAVFRQALNGEFDVVVAMYHDQGLIPVKLLAFDSAVNVTLGLPICRTSPDHGTAYDIAFQNKANPGAMIEAINYCIQFGA